MTLLDLILGSAGEGIYGLDADGLTTFVNPAAAAMVGYAAHELIGQSMHAVLHHSHADGTHYEAKHCPIYSAFKDGKVHCVEDDVFWRRDGSCFPVEYTSTPIFDHGRLAGAVLVFRDITERRKAQGELRAALAQVETLKERLEEENEYLREEIDSDHGFRDIVGNSPALQKALQQVEMVAPTEANVLIHGESGTGKELLARSIHEHSRRSKRPMIKVNCASIPKELFESEFFGHVKGAFTSAAKDRVGRFELADGGTLFLDEVGEIPIDLQSKLLRVLQEGEFERVGEARSRKVDVRVISATNRDLLERIKANEFRQDLYYRLSVFPIEAPPLRDRPEDVEPLAVHFAALACTKHGVPCVRLTKKHLKKLMMSDWPGNVRELQHVVERAVIMSAGGKFDIATSFEELPAAKGRSKNAAVVPLAELKEMEEQSIRAALKEAGGKVYGDTGAAALLGVKPTTLASRMKAMGIERG